MQSLGKTAEVQTKRIKEKNGSNLTFLEKIESNPIILNKEEVADLSKEKLSVLSAWEEFVKINKLQNKTLGFPIWLDFFGFDYTSDEKFEQNFQKTSYGPYGKFQDWKKWFLEKNRSLYKKNKEKCDKWWKKWKRLLKKQKTYCKFEWNGGAELTSIREGIIQFRNSGIRVKKFNFFPALVKSQSLPIIWEKKELCYRYLRIDEALKLQRFSSDFRFPKNASKQKIFASIGNSLNVDLLKYFLQKKMEIFISTLSRTSDKSKIKVRFVDLFSGIGGFHQAIKQLFSESECIAAVDKDKFCKETYFLNYKFKNFYDDITDEEGTQTNLTSPNTEYDLITAGFPCSPFSKAGRMEGLKHPEGKLFDSVVKVIKEYNNNHKDPVKLVILENVSYLAQHDNKKTWRKMKNSLKRIGYRIFEESNYNPLEIGVPQNRLRLLVGLVHKKIKNIKNNYEFF